MKGKTTLDWGPRFRAHLKAKGKTLAQVAEAIGRAESTVRSWTNGTREINLGEFIDLCKAAGLDAALVLFTGRVDAKFLEIGEAWRDADEREREAFLIVAEGIRAKYATARAETSSTAQTIPRRSGARSRS